MSAAAAASSRQQQTRRRLTYPYTLERAPPTPRLLKDFLREDNHYHSPTSCSSSGFTSLPRFSTGTDITPAKRSLNPPRKTQKSNNEPSLTRSRSRSRAAAEATFSLLQKLINAVVVRSVAAAPRRSKKKSLRRVEEEKEAVVVVGGEVGTHVAAAVRVRDILRWKSFRDNAVVVDHDDEEEEGSRSSSCSITVAEQEAERLGVVVLDGSGEAESAAEYRSITTSCSGDGGGFRFDVNAGEEESSSEVPPDDSNWVQSGSWGGGCAWDKVVDEGKAAGYTEEGPATDAKGDDDEARDEPRTSIEEAEDHDDNRYHHHHDVVDDDEDDDDDQPSPVSVLDSPFRDDDAADHEHDDDEEEDDDDYSFSSNFERTKQRLLDSIKRFETLAGVADQPTTTNITADDDDDDDDLFSVEEEEATSEFCRVVESSQSDSDSEEKEDVRQGHCPPAAAAAKSTAPGSDRDRHRRTTVTYGNSIIVDELPTSTVDDDELDPKGGAGELKLVNAAADKGYDRRGRFGGSCRPVGSGVVDAKERRALVGEMERERQWGGFGEEEEESVGCEVEVGLLSDLLDVIVNELLI